MPRLLALAILLVLTLPATALAGTAQIGSRLTDNRYSPSEPALVYSAAPGERNQVVVVREVASGIPTTSVLRDAGARVLAGPGCRALDERTVRCAIEVLVIDVGDGDDAVTVPTGSFSGFGPRSFVHGGDGDDTLSGAGELSGGPGRDVLTGSPNDGDDLIGGAGSDVLRGGDGDDRLVGDGSGDSLSSFDPGGWDDVIDGGEGRDHVLYSGRGARVRVDLEAGTMRAGGDERDRLKGIEDVTGGSGADVLLGDAAGNRLEGHPGHDDLRGGGGNDTLGGGAGTDTLRGEAGNDRLDTRDRSDALFGGAGDDQLAASNDVARPARRFRCGSGDDTVVGDPRGGRLDGCERLKLFGGVRVSLQPQRRARGDLRFTWSCDGSSISCDMVLALRTRSRPLARRSVSLPDGARRAFLVHPRRAARRGDVMEVRISGTINYETGGRPRYAASWRVTL